MSISAIRFSYLGQNIQRQATTTNNGEGVTKRSVDLTRANGNEISRGRTVTRTDEGTSVTGGITTARGETTYSLTRAAESKTAELTVTGPNGNTRTMTLQRATGYEPRPGGPITLDPVNPGVVADADKPIDLMA